MRARLIFLYLSNKIKSMSTSKICNPFLARQSVDWIVIIPARLNSSRLPGKPLINICGMSMLERTYRQVLSAINNADKIYIATDAQEIFEHCKGFTEHVVMTSPECLTGTDRLAEVSRRVKADIYFNVQGDEPILPPEAIAEFIEKVLAMQEPIVATAVMKVTDQSIYKNLSVPKMIFSKSGRLLYSSRAAVPSTKSGQMPDHVYKHVCMYSFTPESLETFNNQRQKTVFENAEDLEINRFLELDIPVQTIEVSSSGRAIDTSDDLEYVKNFLARGN